MRRTCGNARRSPRLQGECSSRRLSSVVQNPKGSSATMCGVSTAWASRRSRSLGRANFFREPSIEAEETRLFVPGRSEQCAQFAVAGVAQPHFDGLQWHVKGRADARIPFIECNGVPRVAVREAR